MLAKRIIPCLDVDCGRVVKGVQFVNIRDAGNPVEVAKRYNEPDEVLNAIMSHHEDEEANCIESVLVKAADTLSAARPGARREMVQSYIKRLEALEGIAESFKGVEKCYAIQAGREIRVAVTPDESTDA